MVLLQCSVAWVASYVVYAIGLLVTGAVASVSLVGLLVAVVLVAGIALYLRSQRGEIDLSTVSSPCASCPSCKSGGCH